MVNGVTKRHRRTGSTLVIVAVAMAEPPMVTLPKSSGDGDTVRVGAAGDDDVCQ